MSISKMIPFEKIASYFIHDKLRTTSELYWKATILVYLHIAMIGVNILITIINQGILQERNEPTYLSILTIILLLLIFKKTGNFLIAGNLVAVAWFLFLAPTIDVTGGVHSDDNVWLMLTPLLVLLFSNRRLALFWLGVLIIFYISLYLLGESYPAINRRPYSDNFYACSYILVSGFIFLLLKISENNGIRTINELDKKNRQLEAQKKEILEQTEALKKIEQQLKSINQELESFAYSASHALKEPLRTVKMYIEFLKRSLITQLESNQLEYIGFVTEGVTRMQKLLDDLLMYSRLGKNVDDVKDVDLNERLRVVKDNLTVLIQETQAQIIVNPLPSIKASSTEMSQLFQNIIANAIKFRKQNTIPEIKVSVIETDKEYTFSIEDNGIGIKKEYQDKVFALFQRLHSSAVYEGSGIGLATCKKIVENMGGRMWLTSTENVGTTFFFTLPKENHLLNDIPPMDF